MKAIDLLHRYASGAINYEQSGIIEKPDYETLESFVRMMFGDNASILFGELDTTNNYQNYIYAYAVGDRFPDGFNEDDIPAMCVELPENESVWIFEIED